MKHRDSIFILVALVVMFALLSLWMPWYVLLILLFMIAGSSPLGRHPWQFIKRKIQNYRIVADYERQRKAREETMYDMYHTCSSNGLLNHQHSTSDCQYFLALLRILN